MKKRRDLRLLIAAALLLICAAGWVLWSSLEVRERRDATLAGVPAFPQPRQEPVRRPHVPSAPQPAVQPPAKPAAAKEQGRQDKMVSLVQGTRGTVALVHVNALLNTPLFDRLRQCMPKEFAAMSRDAGVNEVDFTRDIDQVAMIPGGGVAISGFFEGKPFAERMVGSVSATDAYRGATVSTGAHGQCAAQLGNLMVFGSNGDCRGLLDRALEPTTDAAQDEVYGDVYMRTDLEGMRNDPTAPPALKPLIDGLSGLTLRANVWDSVALSVEGNPLSGKDANDLAAMSRGAMQLFKSQLDDDQVELQALAGLAKVNTEGGKLNVDLALPVADLFDKLHIPCPGLADAGVP